MTTRGPGLPGAILATLADAPWAMEPGALARFAARVAKAVAAQPPPQIEAAADPAMRAVNVARPQRARRVGLISIDAPLVHRPSWATKVGMAQSAQTIQAALRAAAADPTIDVLVLDIDSPGGEVFGIEELANDVAAFPKPVVAVANSLAASGAYWIASQAHRLVVTPSGEVGSIGVYGMHIDASGALEQAGLRPTLVSAGRFKTEGTLFAPLSEEGRAAMQGRVDDYYAAFVRAVARGRGVPAPVVQDGFGEGRLVGAEQALRMGMVDAIATLDEVLVQAQIGEPGRRRPAAAAGDAQGARTGSEDRDEIELRERESWRP